MFQKPIIVLSLFSLLATCAFAQGLTTTAKPSDWEEINFEFNSAVLTDGYPSLLRMAELLQQNPGYRIRVEGHTDWIGSNQYNQNLGLKRANTVRDFLVKYGARLEQVQVVSEGEAQPKYGGDTRNRRQSQLQRWMNRRVSTALLNEQGQVVAAGGMADTMKGFDELLKKQQECCDAILKRLDKLDEIANMLRELKAENDRLRKDVDDLKQAQGGIRQQVAELPKPLSREETTDISRAAATQAIDAARMRRFSILGLNAGSDDNGNLTFSGRGRYFAPFKDKFAVQAQGEYMHWHDRQEGQFDLGLVTRVVPRFQAGLFTSFKHISLRGMQQGGTLGQGSVTLDYLFGRGRVGIFGSKGFMNEAVVNRAAISRNILEEQYLRIVDQVGASATVGLYGRSYLEGNLGYLKSRAHADRPGGSLRFVFPFSDRIAFTLEGGMNETLLSRDNYGRVVAGLQFGNFLSPKEYMAVDHAVPTEVPRVRYELLTRRIRTGNDAPVADAGADQIGVPVGQVTLDGSGSYDPDNDPITYQWEQIAGPAVSLSGMGMARANFNAAEGQNYAFRLTVTDNLGAKGTARVNVSTRTAPPAAKVQIIRFTASPGNINAGDASTLTWQVENADQVTISGVGTVDPKSGNANVTPTSNTTYTLTARNSTSEQTASVTVTVARSLPRVNTFTATPMSILSGECSTLAWTTENADTVSITNLGGVALNGSQSVCPTETTTYTLTATNQFGQTTASQTVQVTTGPKPRIIQFAAAPTTIDRGQTSTLTWNVENATEVEITTLGKVAATGSQAVQPTETTTYTLTARNDNGDSTATATVTVNQVPVSPTLTACSVNPATPITAGMPATLVYTAQNAEAISVSGIGSVPLGAPVTVKPTTTTTYIITATGKPGSTPATCSVTVNVTQPQPPIAVIAGPGFIETLNREVVVDASASKDPNGGPLTFLWEPQRTGMAVLDQGQPITRVIIGGLYGDYVLKLTVKNQAGLTSEAFFTVRFRSTTIF